MKKITLTTVILIFLYCGLNAQQEKGITGYNNWLDTWTDFKPNKANYDEPNQILSGDIFENTTLTKRNTYLLLGEVFVTNCATLTIEPGTVILGDYSTNGSLTISKGSKIQAVGTATDPIIFTSNKMDKKAGDWGGIFILGNAPINTFGKVMSLNYGLNPSSTESISYGGDDENSDSGILKYVRVEYAGKKTKEFGNYSAITLAGVGLKTTINNVMVSYSDGNSYNVLGGNVTISQSVSYRSSKNDFNFNYGTQCSLRNSLAVRSPYISSADGSRCLNINSYDLKENADTSKKETNVIAENLTLLNVSNDLESDIQVGLVQEAIYLGTDVSFQINKSVISGFSPAVYLDTNMAINSENLDKIKFTRSYFNNCNGNIFRKDYINNDDLESWYGSRAFDNVYSKGPDSETFINSNHSKYPDFRLRINKIIASNDTEQD
ncbi:hypothetical protein [uncultured Winogradskyella sp.]|uniref:hypothetical protein n=1 Tax=Winogradskyella sp. 4-2091 TaxID=3381659 RepID=UPI00262AAAD0|nr:hypothetical protein [uncultured Winogradskyella sp.]